VETALHMEKLDNGLVLLGEEMPNVASAAMSIILPGGSASDPQGLAGAASVAVEWMMRGAGDRDTRAVDEALDTLGAQHHESAQREFTHLASAQLGRNLTDVMAIFADVLRRPRLGEETFPASRDLSLHELAGIEDEPSRKASTLLREQFYPPPLGRCVHGTGEDLQAMTPQALRDHVIARLSPEGMILAVAGNIDWPALVQAAGRIFGDWTTPAPARYQPGKAPRGTVYVQRDSAQTHICLAHEAPPLLDELYYPARLAQTILSGGMSSRLFSEVREKRGLVYHVESNYHAVSTCAGMFTYAGTRPELADQTCEVTIGELRRLAEGVDDDELARARVQTKSRLVMQGESTSSRAGTLASDWFYLGRTRTLEEITDAVEAVTADKIMHAMRAYPPENFTRVVIGPKDLQTPEVG
jgi:predicted Zn-dependent peptidase